VGLSYRDARDLGCGPAFHWHAAIDQLGSSEKATGRCNNLRGLFLRVHKMVLAISCFQTLACEGPIHTGDVGRGITKYMGKPRDEKGHSTTANDPGYTTDFLINQLHDVHGGI